MTGPRPLSDDERAVLDALLTRADVPAPELLREQAARDTAALGCSCGCGTIDLLVPADAPATALPDGPAAEANLNDAAGQPVGGVLLFVRSGFVDRLEVYSYFDPLPMPPPEWLVFD